MRTAAALFLALVLPAAAQTAKPSHPAAESKAPAAPTITDAQRAEFFKAQSAQIQAASQYQERTNAVNAAVAKMQETCGATSTLQMNQAGDPVCVLKPATEKK